MHFIICASHVFFFFSVSRNWSDQQRAIKLFFKKPKFHSCDVNNIPYHFCSSSHRLCCRWHLPFGIWGIPGSLRMLWLSPPMLGNHWSELPAHGLLDIETRSSVIKHLLSFSLIKKGKLNLQIRTRGSFCLFTINYLQDSQLLLSEHNTPEDELRKSDQLKNSLTTERTIA